MSIRELEREMMKLDPDERVLLAERLLGSVPPTLLFEDAWSEEVNRRVAEIRDGTARLVSSEEMFRDALESLE